MLSKYKQPLGYEPLIRRGAEYMAGIRSISIYDKPVMTLFRCVGVGGGAKKKQALNKRIAKLFFFVFVDEHTILLARLWSPVECGSARCC